MHKVNAFFLSVVLLFILGCDDKKASDNAIPVENTTEILNQPTRDESNTNRFKITKRKTATTVPIDYSKLSDNFTLSNIQNKQYSVSVANKKVKYHENTKPILLITFFATWCPPCIHNISYMNDLQKKYKKELLLTGILVHDRPPEEKLRSFLAKHNVNYYVSNSKHNNDFASLIAKTLRLSTDYSIPFTVMYVKGEYFTHYESIVPIEMIDYDIQQALKTIQ